HLYLWYSRADVSHQSAVIDPLTKRALDVNTAASAFSKDVTMTPRFMYGGTAYNQMLIGPGTQLQAFNNDNPMGVLQAGSGVVLARGSQSVTVAVNEVTGLVTLP